MYSRAVKGLVFRQRRKILNMTQVQLAEALGVSSNTVARYERDEIRIPEPVARLIMLLRPKRKR
jgi:transcriptional regulator with XRE-family HTH domain